MTFLNSFCLILAGSAAIANKLDDINRDYYQTRIKNVNQANREIKDSFKPTSESEKSSKKPSPFPPTAEEIKKERELVAKEKDPAEQFEEKPKVAGDLKTTKNSMTKAESEMSEPSPLIPKSLRSDAPPKSESNRNAAPAKGGFTPPAVPDYGDSKAIPGEAAPVIAYPGNEK